MRKKVTTFALFAPFLASIIGAYAWFNTSIGLRSPDSSLRSSGLWLQARTNIAGYTFIPEPVSDSVMEGLGTTNILSGTFFRNADQNSRETSDERPEQSEDELNSSSRPSTLDPGPVIDSRIWLEG